MSDSSTFENQSHTCPNETDTPHSFPRRQDRNKTTDPQMTAMKDTLEELKNVVG